MLLESKVKWKISKVVKNNQRLCAYIDVNLLQEARLKYSVQDTGDINENLHQKTNAVVSFPRIMFTHSLFEKSSEKHL